MSLWQRVLPQPQRGLVIEAAALGMATAWLLPGALVDHGGGAFIIAWLLVLPLVSLPLVTLELALGAAVQAGLPRGLRLTRRRWEPVGWWGALVAAALALVLVTVAALAAAALLGEADRTEAMMTAPAETGGVLRPVGLVALIAWWGGIGLVVWRGPSAVTRLAGVGVLVVLALALAALAVGVSRTAGGAEVIGRVLTPAWSALLDARTWLAAIGQAVVVVVVGTGVIAMRASRQPRTSDITSLALQTTAAAAFGHVLVGVVACLALAGPAVVAQGGVSAPGWERLVAGRLALGGEPLVMIVMAVATALGAAVIVTAVVAAAAERLRINPRHIVVVMALVGVVGGVVLMAADAPGWTVTLTDGLLTTGLLPLAAWLAAIAVWDVGFTAIHDHVAAYATLRPGIWWRSVLGSVVPPLVLGAAVADLLAGVESGRLLTDPGALGAIGGVVLAAVAWWLARQPQPVRGGL